MMGVITLCVIQVNKVFQLFMFCGELGVHYLLSQGILSVDHFFADYALRFEVWRYVTAALATNGVKALVIRLPIQLIYGLYLEWRYGWRKVLGIFFLGTCFAEMFANVMPTSSSRGSGAGGVLALQMAFVASWIMRPCRNQAKYVALTLFIVLSPLFSALNVPFKMTPLRRLYFPSELVMACDLANQNHIRRHCDEYATFGGGAIAGLFLGFVCLAQEENVGSGSTRPNPGILRRHACYSRMNCPPLHF